MSAEQTWFVRVPPQIEHHLRDLQERAQECLRRAAKLDPGDRTEVIRFESLHGIIDQLATAAMANGAPAVWSNDVDDLALPAPFYGNISPSNDSLPQEVHRWLAEGAVVARLRVPHGDGPTAVGGEVGRGPSPPAERWQASVADVRQAARERFDALLATALDGSNEERGVVRPSDVSNTVLTESLRKAVGSEPGLGLVELRVSYRDGSEGPRFPMRALRITASSPPTAWTLLRFTLMSIRHVEMDTLVDGAWFRNSKLSRPRAAGLTDELAFETSRQQLKELRSSMPVVIHLYQTGLEPAVMGFYRAVVVHLMAHPGTLAVVPHYYEGEGRFVEGTPWRTL